MFLNKKKFAYNNSNFFDRLFALIVNEMTIFF